ncbi:hypothetical protein ONZ45_g15367 [Pleurotus djamor]|nr:hypothetical protein ONZ45_g15367 [Pleurotus djamor]
MDNDDEWSNWLRDHPIFSLPRNTNTTLFKDEESLELSTSTLPKFIKQDREDGPTPSGRRRTMVLKDSELILAAGKELRMTSLMDSKLNKTIRKCYKTLNTPNIQFDIHEMSLNPSGKLLAVSGAFQVAVVVLPRPGVTRLVQDTIDCKSVQIGQFYHSSQSSVPIAKIQWHPWGDAGSTLMVMTVDGKLHEYDISVDTEEPQQVVSFLPERKSKSFVAVDESEREVASFTFGRGTADWGPLTVYAITRSGDVYAICPYMPQNASVPSAYIHALECFVSAKQEYLDQATTSKSLSTVYDYQHKYISALMKQLPPGTVFPASSRSVPMHPPSTIKPRPMRQGPFLLQPAPRSLEGSEGGDATDIVYLSCGSDDDQSDQNESNQLGMILVAFQDGKVDVCLDLEKIEAKWETKHATDELPMLAVYETIDLGLVSSLKSIDPLPGQPPTLDLLQANHPVFLQDPIHYDTVYIYHAFGVHSLRFASVLKSLFAALNASDEDDPAVASHLAESSLTEVRPLLYTFSVERNIFILTSTMRITSFPLSLRTDSPVLPPIEPSGTQSTDDSDELPPLDGPLGYLSLLGNDTYQVPSILSRPLGGLPINPRLSLPPGSNPKEFMITPDTLRYLGTTVNQLSNQIHEIQFAFIACQQRAGLQRQEFAQQREKCAQLISALDRISEKHQTMNDRVTNIQSAQTDLLKRLDRTLQNLMQKASPILSEHETKWFEELKRMKQEVAGEGRFDESSLVSRTRLMEREFKRILPSLKVLAEKEKQLQKSQLGSSQTFGLSQAFELGERSSHERAKIAEAEKEITNLASKLDIPLSKPPQLS